MGSTSRDRRRLAAYARAAPQARIFARLRDGWAHNDIARDESLSAKRLRRIVAEALKRRPVSDEETHVRLQIEPLSPALQAAGAALANGDARAIRPLLKVLHQLDRYHEILRARAPGRADDPERLLDRMEPMAAPPDAAGPELEGRRLAAPTARGTRALPPPRRKNGRRRMTIIKHSIDLETAEKAVAAAAKKAAEMNLKMCIAVTDESGDLKAFARMDGASKLSIQISQDKAYTAASYLMPTHAWFEFIKNDPPLLHGITHTPRLIVFGGGFPIVIKGEMIGAIGLSGGHYTQDMECARAALAAVGADAL